MEHPIKLVKPSTHGPLLLKGAVLVCAFVMAIPAMTWADTLPGDPDILISTGGDAFPITGDGERFSNIGPTGAASGLESFSFFNNTGHVVTSLTFTTHVQAGLAANPFSCVTNDGLGGADGFGGYDYFLHCSAQYDPMDPSGALTYSFFGVVPDDGDEVASIDSEMNEHEGIPVLGTCDPTVDPMHSPCVFTVTFRGWQSNAAIFTGLNGAPGPFSNTFTTPEPSFPALLALQCLLLVSIAVLVRCGAKRKAQRAE